MHHQLAWIESGGRRAAYVGDLLPTAAHLAPTWIMGFDVYPADTFAAKKAFLREAIEQGTLVFLYHDPAIAAGFITGHNGEVSIRPA
jgi:glyoxylase-like metal-dependent hydrolase (beta-lactamase superfamily II)